MILRSQFPDAEALVIGFLADVLGPEIPVHNEIPDSWDLNPQTQPDDVPCVVVELIPTGGFGEEYEATPTLEITLMGRSKVEVIDTLLRPLEQALPGLPQRRPTVDSLEWPQRFGFVGYANRTVRKAVGRIQLTTRPIRSTS